MSRNASKSSLRDTEPMPPKPVYNSTPGLNAVCETIALDNLPASTARICDQLDIASVHNDNLFSLLVALGGSEYYDTDQPDRSAYNPGSLGYLQYLASLLEYQNQRRSIMLRALGELI